MVAASRVARLVTGPTGRPLPVFPQPEPLTRHGPARVVAVCNQKGGVGKTTTTINLGAALAEFGRRVLLVDFDPQGALSVGLGIQPHELDYTIYNLLMERGASASEVVVKTSVAGMELLPSNIDLSGAEVQLVHEVGREFVLGGVLEPLVPDYDVILIDCQPSLGLLTVNALACADGILVPLECEYFAMRGVALLTETIDKVSRRINPRRPPAPVPTGNSPRRCWSGGGRQVAADQGQARQPARCPRTAPPRHPRGDRLRWPPGQRP